MSFGVCSSTKPSDRMSSRNSCDTPDCTRKMAWLAGVRRSTHRLSSRVSRFTVAIFSPAACTTCTQHIRYSQRSAWMLCHSREQQIAVLLHRRRCRWPSDA